MVPTPAYPMHASRSAADVDVHSIEATDAPDIRLARPEEHDWPILIFRCLNAVGTCVMAKQWHYQTFGYHGTPDLLRIDTQVLHELDQEREGTLLVLENVGTIPSKHSASNANPTSVHVMALLIPKDTRIRFFYSIVPYAPLITDLVAQNTISPRKKICPSSSHNNSTTPTPHNRILTLLASSFACTLQIPHAPDYTSALSLTDFSPSILLPTTTALQRITRLAGEQGFPLHSKDLSSDRYLLQLHPAERELASVSNLHCAEYMLTKRVFFKEFYEEVMKTEKKIGEVRVARSGTGKGKPVRLRSETQHIAWFERVYNWSARRAKRLVCGWEVLGLLDERRLLPWIKAGGMLAGSDLVDEVEYEGADGDADDEAATDATQSGRETPDD